MPSKPPSSKPFTSLVDGPTLTMPTLNPLTLNHDVAVDRQAAEELGQLLSEREARGVSRATPTEFRNEERREIRRQIADLLNLDARDVPAQRPAAQINYAGDAIWISLDSFGGEIWSGSPGLYVHRALRSAASFVLLRSGGSSVGFACEGGPGTYLFAARVETRQRTIRAYAIENTDPRGAQDLQVAGDKALMLVDFPRGGRVGVLYSCGGQHPVKIFGVEVYRVR
ncbi:MAG: hypothetical protein R3A79_21190 [Nannocystaceae bacterium]